MNLTFDEFLKFPGKDGSPLVKGIAVGYCVQGDEWTNRRTGRELGTKRGREKAHTHCEEGEKYAGWICVRTPEELGRRHRVSGTMMHELAHLISKTGHDDKWRRAMARLGQFVGPAWMKKSRAT